LVKRGELYFTLDFLESWDANLEELNQGKVGRKFELPWSFIEALIHMHVIFHLPYRRIEEFLYRISESIPKIQPTDYTNIWKRAAKLNINLKDTIDFDEPVIYVDSSGIKVVNRDEWREGTWISPWGWIKVYLAVDMKTKDILKIEITDKTRLKPFISQTVCNASYYLQCNAPMAI